MKCEFRELPLGINTSIPRLSWIIRSNQRRGEIPKAYRILAASTAAKLARGEADLWDSGTIEEQGSVHVVYAGKSLRSSQTVWWKVRVRNGAGGWAESEPAWFEMALLSPADWQGRWIQAPSTGPASEPEAFEDRPAPMFRTEFIAKKKIARARAYVSGLGYYELRLNGRRVGDQWLDPGWTTYSHRVLYSCYDITSLLKFGRNAVGIILGNGWFNPLPLKMWGRINPGDALVTGEPRAILQIFIKFTDGTCQTVFTDESWRVSTGPILRNSVYLGEVYDARREQTGWDKAGFDDADWDAAAPAAGPEIGPLRAQEAPPIRMTRSLKPLNMTQPLPGRFIFDFGQNFAGCVRLKVRGKRGTTVRLRSGELLYRDGTLNGMTAVVGQIKDGGADYHYDGVGRPKTAFQLDEYVLKGRGTEVFTPRFTFHGFRYVELIGFPGRPKPTTLEGLRLNADLRQAGSFECSNELFNRIQQMTLRSELSNVFSVQSDCPHREKLAYGGDIVASSEMAILNFDMSRFYAKTAQDFVDSARPNGGFTETAPFVGICDQSLGDDSVPIDLGEGTGPIDYGTVQPLLVWQLWQYYGDNRPMSEHYEATKRWIDLLRSKARHGILDNGISDHESLEPKPRALTGTAFYYFNLSLFAKIAGALDQSSDAVAAEKEAKKVRDAFNRQFLKRGTGRYGSGSQTCQAFALYFDLVPPAERAGALDVLIRDIAAYQGHLTTGIFGTKYMLNVLTEAGRAEVAYAIVNQRSFPGWGYMLEHGATTLWEHWAYSDDVYSHNHPMFGSVSEWFYKSLAGIQIAPDAVACDKLVLRPQPAGDLEWVSASYDSIRGKIVSAWKKSGRRFAFDITIPPTSTAVVHVPADDVSAITENSKPASESAGVTFLRREGNAGIFAVGPGSYSFASRLK